jgi:hypothetical protein
MRSRPHWQRIAMALMVVVMAIGGRAEARAQAALLMEEPYGFFGTLNPTGHTAIYFARICADTPVQLRHCNAGETGTVISRYQGIAGYDWVAMPLLPYFYSVEYVSDVPDHVYRATVRRLRDRYHEDHLGALGQGVFEGNIVHGGWTQLVGVAYERRIYAFRFATSEAQDVTIIQQLNSHPNRSDFNLIYNNCADFARSILNLYFPGTFRRNVFPDAGMTTPKQITNKLVRYAQSHPEAQLTVYEIPQIPGYRRSSRSNKSVAASLITTAYAIPITIMNPYLAGGLFVDYLVRGRYPLVPEHHEVLSPQRLVTLTTSSFAAENPDSAGTQAASAAVNDLRQFSEPVPVTPGLKEIVATHEPD